MQCNDLKVSLKVDLYYFRKLINLLIQFLNAKKLATSKHEKCCFRRNSEVAVSTSFYCSDIKLNTFVNIWPKKIYSYLNQDKYEKIHHHLWKLFKH